MNPFSHWLTTRRQHAEARAFREGFDWMAGELLRGNDTPEQLEWMHQSAMWSQTAFDNGAIEALRKWRGQR